MAVVVWNDQTLKWNKWCSVVNKIMNLQVT